MLKRLWIIWSKNPAGRKPFKDFRPWGWFESLKLDSCFQVKRIFVKPGAVISLQSQSTSEHWVVVEGMAKVRIDDEVKLINKGHSVYVPKGVIHRMENPGEPQRLYRGSNRKLLGEDDIERYEDLYCDSKGQTK